MFFLLASVAFASDHLLVDYLSVGQGDGVLIRTPEGQVVLIDGGKPSGDADEQLAALGVTRIDLLIATHADYDHAGVHEDILAAFPVDTYITNGLAGTSQSYARITAMAAALEAAGRTDVRTIAEYAAGEDVGWGDLHLYLMRPPASVTGTDQNTHSVGVMAEYGDFRTLITGDSEKKETDAWLSEGLYDDLLAEIDVYKAIHHGSRDGDALNYEWLNALEPETVVIQVGRNGYGHPTAEAVATYGLYTADVFRTDVDGRVQAEVWASGGYTLRTDAAGLAFASGDAVAPDSDTDCPSAFPVKAYVLDGLALFAAETVSGYDTVEPTSCYAGEDDATAAGYRAQVGG